MASICTVNGHGKFQVVDRDASPCTIGESAMFHQGTLQVSGPEFWSPAAYRNPQREVTTSQGAAWDVWPCQVPSVLKDSWKVSIFVKVSRLEWKDVLDFI